MKKITIICLTVVFTTLFCFGIVRAFSVGSGTLEVDSLKVGKQDEGGVTFFNGTIVNNTSDTYHSNNPVTFGDDVRIDGRVYRGWLPGPGYSDPFIINDDVKIEGDLTVSGDLKLIQCGDNEILIYDATFDKWFCTDNSLVALDCGSGQIPKKKDSDNPFNQDWECSDDTENITGFIDCVDSYISDGDEHIKTSTWTRCKNSWL